MLNWLIHEMANDPAALAGVIAAVFIPLIGWVGTAVTWVVKTAIGRLQRKDEERNRERERNEEQHRYETTIATLKAQVNTLQEANRLLKEANPVISDPLSEARLVKGHMFSITNEGNRPIVVMSAESEEGPDCATYDDFPLTIKHGEALRYMMPWPVNVVVEWKYEGEDDSMARTTKRMSARS